MLRMNSALVDTSYWIALFDARDKHHAMALARAEYLDWTSIIPWPIMYETLGTRFIRRPEWVDRLDRQLKSSNIHFVDDSDYRDEVYSLVVDYSTRLRRGISMIDMLCRLLIADPAVRINYLLTTNLKDFAELCTRVV